MVGWGVGAVGVTGVEPAEATGRSLVRARMKGAVSFILVIVIVIVFVRMCVWLCVVVVVCMCVVLILGRV